MAAPPSWMAGFVPETTRLKGFALDAQARTVTAGAGVTIGELRGSLVGAGWMLPVCREAIPCRSATRSRATSTDTPPVRPIPTTVAVKGSVVWLGGTAQADRPPRSAAGAPARGGGMCPPIGLRPVSGRLLSVDADRVDVIDQAVAALAASGGPHRVTWLDLLCSRPGRAWSPEPSTVPADRSSAHRGRRPRNRSGAGNCPRSLAAETPAARDRKSVQRGALSPDAAACSRPHRRHRRVHVCGHLPGLGRALRGTEVPRELSGAPSGPAGSWIALTSTLVGGSCSRSCWSRSSGCGPRLAHCSPRPTPLSARPWRERLGRCCA